MSSFASGSFETPIALILRANEVSVSKDEGNGLLRMRRTGPAFAWAVAGA